MKNNTLSTWRGGSSSFANESIAKTMAGARHWGDGPRFDVRDVSGGSVNNSAPSKRSDFPLVPAAASAARGPSYAERRARERGTGGRDSHFLGAVKRRSVGV